MDAPAAAITGIEPAAGETCATGAAGWEREGLVSGIGASVDGARRAGAGGALRVAGGGGALRPAGGGALRAAGAACSDVCKGGAEGTDGEAARGAATGVVVAARGGSDGGAFRRGGGEDAAAGANNATAGGATDGAGGAGGATEAAGGATDAVGGGGVIDDACWATSAAALNSVSARTSSFTSDACSAARRSHFNASERSPRPHSAPAVERAQLTSSSSFGSGFGIGERASIWLPGVCPDVW